MNKETKFALLMVFVLMVLFPAIHKFVLSHPEPVRRVDPAWAHYYETEIRAYCPCEKCCPGFADGITASGAKAEGLIVASSIYEFGTKIDIPGYGVAIVLDRGPNIVEVFFSDHDEALEWGVKKLKVKVSQTK